MVLIIFILILIGSGFIAERVFSLISYRNERNGIVTGLAFALLIFITNTLGMYFVKGLVSFAKLQRFMDTVVYTSKYTFLSILVGIILAIIAGIVGRTLFKRKIIYKNKD